MSLEKETVPPLSFPCTVFVPMDERGNRRETAIPRCGGVVHQGRGSMRRQMNQESMEHRGKISLKKTFYTALKIVAGTLLMGDFGVCHSCCSESYWSPLLSLSASILENIGTNHHNLTEFGSSAFQIAWSFSSCCVTIYDTFR